jgi:uncharacterized protein
MELTGSTFIPLPAESVWAALNDGAVLQRCITGCESIERSQADKLTAKLAVKLGPVRAKFTGNITLSNVRPLQGYTLTFEGSGGAAGFAKGTSDVELQAIENGTQINYTAQASVGGKLGQIGGRMIDAAARSMADEFFAALLLELSQAQVTGTATTANVAPDAFAPVAATPISANEKTFEAPKLPVQSHRDGRLVWFIAGIVCGASLLLIGKHFL